MAAKSSVFQSVTSKPVPVFLQIYSEQLLTFKLLKTCALFVIEAAEESMNTWTPDANRFVTWSGTICCCR